MLLSIFKTRYYQGSKDVPCIIREEVYTDWYLEQPLPEGFGNVWTVSKTLAVLFCGHHDGSVEFL